MEMRVGMGWGLCWKEEKAEHKRPLYQLKANLVFVIMAVV